MDLFKVTKKYLDDKLMIKGNGFDCLSIGDDREDVEEFINFINGIIKENYKLKELIKYLDL